MEDSIWVDDGVWIDDGIWTEDGLDRRWCWKVLEYICGAWRERLARSLYSLSPSVLCGNAFFNL